MIHKTLIFLGPSLSLTEAKSILPDAIYHPPVQCGDIIRGLHLQPDIIAIIDGYFEHSAAVWHKEILLALTQNIKVYGAASMGALRAAELAPLGMMGVGKIYSDFYNNVLNDDDEVAVVHRPDKSNYESITDAMVNIRATLQQALHKKIITRSITEHLLQHAKSQFYKQRSLNKTLAWYTEQHGANDVEDLRQWLVEGNFVDQKKLDAIELLKILVTNDGRPSTIPTEINNTILLHKLNERCQCEPTEPSTETEDVKRYTRLLAYSLKTSKRLNIPLLTTEQARHFIQEDKTAFNIFYALFLLFDAPLLLQTNNVDKKFLLDTNNKHVNILLIASALISAVREILSKEQMRLRPEKMTLYINEIMQLLAKKISPEQAKQQLNNLNIDTLIDTYFILKDVINNGADAFLSPTSSLLSQPYYTSAQQLYLIL